MLAETQDLTQEDHTTDELINSADLLERADRAHQEVSRQFSGFDDDAELQEHEVIDSWPSHDAGRSQEQLNGISNSAPPAASSKQWNQALLMEEHAAAPQQHSMSQQMHHARISNVQQQHVANISPQHQAHRLMNRLFQDSSAPPQPNDGYANMQAQGSFSVGRVSKFFASKLPKPTSAAALPQAQHHMLLEASLLCCVSLSGHTLRQKSVYRALLILSSSGYTLYAFMSVLQCGSPRTLLPQCQSHQLMQRQQQWHVCASSGAQFWAIHSSFSLMHCSSCTETQLERAIAMMSLTCA